MDFYMHFSSPSVILLLATSHQFGGFCNVQKSYVNEVHPKNSQDWMNMENRNKYSENREHFVEY